MALSPIDSVIYLQEVNRKRYGDVGEVKCGYAAKFNMYKTSRDILEGIKAYIRYLEDETTQVVAMVDVTEGNFFWLNSVYLKYIIKDENGTHTLDVMINPKESIEYGLLKNTLDGDPVLVSAYVNYWRKCLRYVGDRVGVNLFASEV